MIFFITKLNHDLTVDSSIHNAGTSTITFKRNHFFNGVVTGTITDPSSSRTQGTYYNVKLYNSNVFTDANWDGATAKVTVGASSSITNFEIQSPGSGYAAAILFTLIMLLLREVKMHLSLFQIPESRLQLVMWFKLLVLEHFLMHIIAL